MQKKTEITIVLTTTNKLSSSSSSSSIKAKNNHGNDAKPNTIKKTETNVTAPILVTSVSTPLTSVLQCNNTSSSNSGTIVKKPGIILLTQASLSKLLSASDLNVINNNSNTNTANHVHSHQHDNNIRSKCNIAISTTNPSSSQNNNQLTSVLMINSTSTIETTAGVVTLTSTAGSTPSVPNRDASDEHVKNNSQQTSVLSNRNLPATPKSITEPQIQGTETLSSAIRSDNENSMDNEATGDEEKTEYEYSEDYDDSTSVDNQQRFILAPTPAQLGRAETIRQFFVH